MANMTATIGRPPVIVHFGENTVGAMAARAEAQVSAASAEVSAAYAESMTGPTYADTSAGLAATSDGEGFAVDNGDGTVTVYLNDGGSAVEQRTLATTTALASSTGEEMVGTQYPELGSRLRTFAEVAVKEVELSGFDDADPTMATDSYAALLNAIAAASARKGELIIDGSYRVSLAPHGPINITVPTTIRGAQRRASNVPDYAAHQAAIYIDDDPADVFTVGNGGQLTLDSVALIGSSTSSTGNGLRNTDLNSLIRLCNGAVVQGFNVGWRMENGYYNRVNDATFADCMVAVMVSAPSTLPPIYNFVASQLKIDGRDVAGSVGMTIFGESQVSLSGCSIERCHADGIQIGNATLVSLGCYFENKGGWNIHTFAGAKVHMISNRVYLDTGCPRFISNDGAGTEGVEVFARGNVFKVPTDTTAADVYRLNTEDPLAVTDLAGDVYHEEPGENVRYLHADFVPKALMGQHRIAYPAGHAKALQPVSTLPLYIPPSQSGLDGDALEGMFSNFGCNGFSGDDPGGWRLDGWGANPMGMIFHKSMDVPGGQWEKVGLRLPFIAAPTGGATVDAEARAWIADLIDALNKQAVMPSS